MSKNYQNLCINLIIIFMIRNLDSLQIFKSSPLEIKNIGRFDIEKEQAQLRLCTSYLPPLQYTCKDLPLSSLHENVVFFV